VFGLSDLADDPDLATNGQRVAAREKFLPRLQQTFRRMTREEIVRLCEVARLPFAPIQRPEDLVDDPNLNEPGALTEVTLADGRTARLPSLPLDHVDPAEHPRRVGLGRHRDRGPPDGAARPRPSRARHRGDRVLRGRDAGDTPAHLRRPADRQPRRVLHRR
jgi:hypothetical protein